MKTIGSVEAMLANEARGFICYPRRYEDDRIIGVDNAGQDVVLMLDVPDRFVEAAKKETDKPVPKIQSMKETHKRAQNPCIAMEDNGPLTHSGGCFVAEQVTPVEGKPGVFKAHWLSILKNWESDPEPMFGYGYLETNVSLASNAETENKKVKLIDMNDAIRAALASKAEPEQINGIDTVDFIAARNELAMDLFIGAKNKWYIGVDVQFRRLEVASLENESLFRRQVLELIQSNSVKGMYGGVIMRPVKVVNGERIVQVDSVRRIDHKFDYAKAVVPPVDKAWDDWIGKGSGWIRAMKRDGYEVELIPIQRINAGRISNEKYSKEYLKEGRPLPKQVKAWVDSEFHNAPYVSFALQNAYLVTPIAIRCADTRAEEFAGNILLSSIHAFGKAFGNTLELDKDMRRTLKLSAKPVPTPYRPRTHGTATPSR
jgi:hypothetical protein